MCSKHLSFSLLWVSLPWYVVKYYSFFTDKKTVSSWGLGPYSNSLNLYSCSLSLAQLFLNSLTSRMSFHSKFVSGITALQWFLLWVLRPRIWSSLPIRDNLSEMLKKLLFCLRILNMQHVNATQVQSSHAPHPCSFLSFSWVPGRSSCFPE